MTRRIAVRTETWPSLVPFRIANVVFDDFPLIVCDIEEDGITGSGEALGVYYLDETPESMTAQIEAITAELSSGADRQQLADLLPPGGARFAVDSALWDLEAQLGSFSAWDATGVEEAAVETVFTIGLEAEPETMAAKAAAAKEYGLLKVKLDADRPVERIAAVRNAHPDSRIIVDVNQGWNFEQLQEFAPQLRDLDVRMIEQPLPRGKDGALAGYESPVVLCADESCRHLGELEQTLGRYGMINIKLDKTGGLTHALELARAALAHGLRLMAGSMGGTSLSMAPTHVIAQLCEIADIDGPLLIGDDRPGGLVYAGGHVSLPPTRFWGTPSQKPSPGARRYEAE
ncbi:MAG: dipeptide epimerase [Gammaproteobacteria bacterium]|nr:dipeptide epimerase [Gammaproteobacteria bacterium]MBU2676403.1 dipeptide epimerase [Gammaproteobacteria bacterium]NNC57505.1 dipeptide epimerase [Woeseiaceae bacterium]NNL50138.1 dipeptide epimerase [Woeseiaceae bacterium]